jgi:hypothetical protein
MNRCKQCNSEYEPKRATSQYCSPSCRVKAGRVSVTDQPGVSVTEVSVTQPESLSVTIATRTNPDQLNYGKPLSLHELNKAGLKANRVPIPGDHDYTGVCKKVDGNWIVPNKDRTEPEQEQDG